MIESKIRFLVGKGTFVEHALHSQRVSYHDASCSKRTSANNEKLVFAQICIPDQYVQKHDDAEDTKMIRTYHLA